MKFNIRFILTIVISVLLGVIGGATAYQIYTFFSAEEIKLQVAATEPMLLAGHHEEITAEGQAQAQEIIAAEEITSESIPEATKVVAEPTPEPIVYSLFRPEPVVSVSPSPSPSIEPGSIDLVEPIATPSATLGLSSSLIFDLINQYRARLGLQSFVQDERICRVAESRAPELGAEFNGGRMHAGFYARNLPYWATENIIFQRTEQQAVNWWLHSPIHRRSIEGDYQYSCVACSGNNCSEIFTNFTPKNT